MTATTPARAIAYIRISVDRENETSTETQEERIRALCAYKGFELVDVVIEKGRSAYKASRSRRPGVRRLMTLVEASAVDVVIVWKLNRLARNTEDLLGLVRTMKEHGVRFVSVTEDIDTRSSSGKLLTTMLGALAEMESDGKSENIKAWQNKRFTDGAVPGGRRHYGYARTRNTLTVIDDEAAVVREMAARALAGESLRSIARHLNEAGARTSTGATWRPRTVTQTLLSPTTAGLRVREGVEVPGSWPAIISADTHRQLVELLRDPSRRTVDTSARRHLLSGIARCARCDLPLTMKGNVAGPRYTCQGARGIDGCGLSVAIADLDAYVVGIVLAELDPGRWALLRSRGRVDSAAIAAMEEQKARALAMFKAGTLDFDDWQEATETLASRIAAAEAEPLRLPDVEDIRSAWDAKLADDVAARRLVMTAVLEVLTVGPAQKGKNRFDTSRVTVRLVD